MKWYDARDVATRELLATGDAVQQIGAGLERLARQKSANSVKIDLGPAVVTIRPKRAFDPSSP
jgi:hypothetical protein